MSYLEGVLQPGEQVWYQRWITEIVVTTQRVIYNGPDEIEQYRQAAGYVDRFLKGEKPADLPMQAPQPQDREGA